MLGGLVPRGAGKVAGLGPMGAAARGPGAPPVEPLRWMLGMSRGRYASGAGWVATTGNNYVLTRTVLVNDGAPCSQLLANFSARAMNEGGTAPAETVLPATSVFIDKVFYEVGGQVVQALFGGAEGATLASGARIRSDVVTLPETAPTGGEVIEWVLSHVAVGTAFPPTVRIQKERGERVWSGADVASLLPYMDEPLADSTAALDINYGGVSPAQPAFFRADFVFCRGGYAGGPVVVADTDSIPYGRQVVAPGAGPSGHFGFLGLFLGRATGIGRIPVMYIGCPGARAANELAGGNTGERHAVLEEVRDLNGGAWPMTHIVFGMSNDAAASVDAWWTAVGGALTRLGARYPGVPIVPITLLGRTTSSDRHTTIAGQSITANWGPGSPAEAVNDRLRANYGGLHSGKVIDAFAAWQNADAAWKWRTGGERTFGQFVEAKTGSWTSFRGTVSIPMGQKVAFQTTAAAWTGRTAITSSGAAPDITFGVLEAASHDVAAGAVLYEQVTEEGTHPHLAEHARIADGLTDQVKAAVFST